MEPGLELRYFSMGGQHAKWHCNHRAKCLLHSCSELWYLASVYRTNMHCVPPMGLRFINIYKEEKQNFSWENSIHVYICIYICGMIKWSRVERSAQGYRRQSGEAWRTCWKVLMLWLIKTIAGRWACAIVGKLLLGMPASHAGEPISCSCYSASDPASH